MLKKISLFLILIVMWAGCRAKAAETQTIELPPPPAIAEVEIVTLLGRDAIQSIDNPQFVLGRDNDNGMTPNEKVIGLLINGDARAYPIPILSTHEIVNDTVGGQPVAITWCPLCYSAIVYSRQPDGVDTSLTFGVSGKLLQNTLVMYDRETESLWSQLYGGAISGDLNGTPLPLYSSAFTTWESWLAQHPNTKVLSKKATCTQFDCGTYATNPRGSYTVDPYQSYYAMPAEGVIDFQIPREENANDPKKRVLGVRVGTNARAYPLDSSQNNALIHDMLGNSPIVVWYNSQQQTGNAFLRVVDGTTLTFQAAEDNPLIWTDDQTGSRWDALTGLATQGKLAGSQLPPVINTLAFEFGWYGYFPDSTIHE